MKRRIYAVLVVLCLFNVLNVNASTYTNLKVEHCSKEAVGPYVYSNDFSWGMSLNQIKEKSTEIYNSGKRLRNRAFFDGKNVVMPLSVSGGDALVKLSPRFLESVQKHIEVGYKRGYIDAVIFPDMGHSHFFIPKKYYEEVLAPMPNSKRGEKYELMINHPELKILYHTAEQLTMLDENKKPLPDRMLQWRFYTRNLVGDNKALGRVELLHETDSSHNTGRDYDDNHRYWGHGFNLSASKEGCFSFTKNGKTFYFDLSFDDLTSSSTDGWDF
ncbi:MAG: hypothetical protein CME70_20350 [Halobacteriovorax sp.]|nr:hypothetical protein [Halobacteriovorax sp.]|tara:strand:- start:59122 stop:59937 length:816 start_codon:yes stop_codon:yes gene_type:complete